ncbi:putative aminomethyl transferase [Thermoascus aurantiacus ATCC 26904]
MPPRTPTSSICRQCLARARGFSTSAPARQQQKQHDLPPPPPRTGYVRLTNRGLISITGQDSTTFLQGLITQNMLIPNDPNRATRRTACYTAFLNAQGRVLHDAFIYPSPGGATSSADEAGWIVEVDKNEVPNLLRHLKKHKLRAKLNFRALEDGERTVWSTWDDENEPRWAAYNLESDSPSPFSNSPSILGCVDSRAPGLGSRIVTPGTDDLRTHFPDESKLPGKEVGLATYTLRRMLHGVAEGQGEIHRESALPLECNMDMMRGIDFRKGCYVGQELTIRTHHTGVVRKRILPVQLYNDGDEEGQNGVPFAEFPMYDPTTQLPLPPSGANISRVGARKGRSAGKFLGGIGNIGLALCRLEMMTDIALTGEGTQYAPGQEFKVSWDGTEGGESTTTPTTTTQEPGEVKVKAFVPPWTREFILAGGPRRNASRPDEAEARRAREMVEMLEEEEEEAQQRRGE